MRSARLLAFGLALAGLLALAFVALDPTPSRAQSDQSTLASLVSRLLSTPTTRVSIGAVEGALSSNAVIRDIQVSDRDGVWLRVDEARLVWSRAALLRGRLQVDLLEIGRIDLSRRPLPGDEAPAAEGGSLLPELPVRVDVGRFALRELALGAPVLGAAARISAEGRATLGAPSEGLALRLAATRRDAPGRLSLDLAYVPQTERLRLSVDHDEPAGGIAARLLDLEGLPPVALKLAGEGPLSDFKARLDFAAGPGIGAQGEARVARAGDAYEARLDLAARLASLLPGTVAPLFSGETRLTGGAKIADDGRVELNGLRLASEVAALEVNGAVAADRTLDVKVTGRALPAAREGGAVSVGALDVDLRLRGALGAPRLDGTVEAAEIRSPGGSLGRLDARLVTAPETDAAEPDRFRVSLDAKATGLALADRALGRAIGDSVAVRARGILGTDGVAAVQEARIETPTARATFAGRVGATLLDGRLEARIASLAPFSDLAGSELRGSAELTAALSGEPARPAARLDASLSSFKSGRPALDGLVGASARLTGSVARLADGFALDDLRLKGANLDARAAGRATRSAADVTLRAFIPELKRLDPAITAGRADLDARLTGGLDRPDGSVRLAVEDARALDRPIPRLVLLFAGRDLTGALDASAELDGVVAGSVAKGKFRLARPQPDIWRLDGLDVSVGSARVSGNLATRAGGLAEGSLRVNAADLDDLSPLLLTRLSGELRASLDLAVENGRQAARIEAEGERIAVAGARVDRFDAKLSVLDPLGQPRIEGRVAARSLVAGGETFRDLRLEATPEGGSTRFALTGDARGLALEARGALTPEGKGNRIDLSALQARRGAQRIALAEPARLVLEPGRLRIASLALLVGSGRLTVSGTAGDALDLDVRAAGVPLAAAAIASPGLGLTGVLDGSARIAGSPARPTGGYEIALRNVSAPVLRNAGLSPMNLRAEGRLAEDRATVDATLDLSRGGRLTAKGSVPLGQGDLDLAVRGRIDLALANGLLSETGQRVAGAADIDLAVRGTLAEPVLAGGAVLANGSFEDTLQGIRIEGIAARVAARGREVVLEGLSARTPNGGTLQAAGRVTVDPAAGFPGDIRITGRRAQLASNADATAVADLDLRLSGPLARRPTVAGRIDLLTLDLGVPDRLGAVQRPLPGARHVAPSPQAAARLALERRRQGRASGRPVAPFEAALDLVIQAQNRIFVRGRGIEAELGGDLRLTGTTRDVVAVGAFELRRGRLDILGQRVALTRGRLDFAGDLSPNLDFVAETRAADVTARIAVTGPAAAPEFEITSEPDLPQDEVLSRLLFRRAAGGLSAGQALQLAQAVATLSGGGGGAFENLRRSLGVDSLDITTGAGGGPAVGASRYVTDRIRLGVRAGTRPEESGVTVDVDLTRRLRLQGEAGADGRSSVGIGAEWEY